VATRRHVALNRPVFTQSEFDSGALTVLTALFHRFAEAGTYEALVRRDGRLVARVPIEVAGEHATRQVNVDLAADAGDRGCCAEHSGERLAIGGVAGFHASRGTGRYTVTVTVMDSAKGAKRTLLDSEKQVPEGDVFAVTLVRPGHYSLSGAGSSTVAVNVTLPKPGGDYRPDRPALLTLGGDGKFDRDSLRISSGHTVVVHCVAAARLRVKLVKSDEATKPIGRGKRTVERRKPGTPPKPPTRPRRPRPRPGAR
jgi:hypothetical protein